MALKFVIYDNATGRNTQPASGDSISIPGTITSTESLVGSLVTTNNLITNDALSARGRLALENRFAHINAGKTGSTAQTSGFVFQINGSASSSTITDISSGTLTMDSDPTGTFSAGDIVQVRGSGENPISGLYEVDTVSTSPDEILLSASPTDEFISSSGDLNDDGLGGTLQKVTLSVLRYSAAGALQTATGNTAGFSFSAVGGGGGGGTLQDAYDAGNTIVTDASGGAFSVSGDQAVTLATSNSSGITLSTEGVTAGNIVLDSEAGITLQTTNGLFTGGGINIDTSTDNSSISLFSGNGNISFQGNGNQNFSGSGNANFTNDGNFTASMGGSVLLIGGAITTNNVYGAFQAIANTAFNIDSVGTPIYAVNNSGTVNFAAGDASSLSTAKVVGISLGFQDTAGAVFDAVCLVGSIVGVRFATAPAATSIGSYVYLSETTGRATLTPPTTTGSVVYELGILVTADGSSVVPKILFNPRFVIEN